MLLLLLAHQRLGAPPERGELEAVRHGEDVVPGERVEGERRQRHVFSQRHEAPVATERLAVARGDGGPRALRLAAGAGS